jgi:hypothetical protein
VEENGEYEGINSCYAALREEINFTWGINWFLAVIYQVQKMLIKYIQNSQDCPEYVEQTR